MDLERNEFRLRERTPQAVGALLLFGLGTLYVYWVRDTAANGALYLAFAGLSLVMALAAVVAIFNLITHEAWAIVLTHDAIELPRAPYRSRRRERIPFSAIESISFSPEPPAQPDTVILFVASGPSLRWIRQDALENDSAPMSRVQSSRG